MIALAIIAYLLIGFLCAVIEEIRSSKPDRGFEAMWVLVWPYFLLILGLCGLFGLLGGVFAFSVKFCAQRYYNFRDKRKEAKKAKW